VNPTPPRLASRRTRRHILVAVLAVAALGWLARRGVEAWQYDRELSRAERELDSGRFESARARLAWLSARWPGRDEVEYPLGRCEAALGHVDAALAAWARVPRSSVVAARAALDRARFAVQHGRLAEAEVSLGRLGGATGEVAEDAVKLADQVDLFSGRSYRIGPRIERRWRTAPDQVALLRAHLAFDMEPFPADRVSKELRRMSGESPDDDRVWLGQADLAIRTGRLDEADAWLRKCAARRPDDPAVLRLRLLWALDSRTLEAALAVAERLTVGAIPPAEADALVARLAELSGDRRAELAAVESQVARHPGDPLAWRRMADLAAHAGQVDELARYRQRSADIDRARDVYKALMDRVAAGQTAYWAELARAAESLGRRFEAHAWWSLRVRQAPDDRAARAALDRLAHAPETAPPPPAGLTLASSVRNAPQRPAPAAPAVAQPVPVFRDDAGAAGLQFVYDNARSRRRRLPETMGGGLGLIDYDGDGLLDVYAVQGARMPPDPPDTSLAGGDHLFRNRGDGTFEDVTVKAGIAAFPRGYGHGVSVGDFDNDGRPDLFVTRLRSYALYRNRGDGTFEDVTDRAGLGGERLWPTSSAFADLDGDGDLDLYVCHYLDYDPVAAASCGDPEHPGETFYCSPRAFNAIGDRVFRNDGGRFVDVSQASGVAQADREGRGLGVVAADLDDDGRIDIYVSNDMTANYLFHNLGGLKFEETGLASGAGSNAEGGYQAGMGLACGDVDGDGLPDLAVTNFYGESTSLYRNLGGGQFAERTAASGLIVPTRYVLGFGVFFLDADNDGRLDLVQANGHVNDYRPVRPFAMPGQLFLGVGEGRLVEVAGSGRAGACWNVERVGRGIAVGDLDNDGRLDVLVLVQNGPLAYFHNLGPEGNGPAGHFLTLRLEGTTSNRDAVGAKVTVTAPGQSHTTWRLGGGSFLSACDGRVHVGLGGAGGPAPAVAVEVRWPSGRVERHQGLASDTAYRLVEGDPKPRPLEGWRSR
jgi:enediyne biosynthesis protein E4